MSEQRIAEYGQKYERVCLALHTLWTQACYGPEYDKRAWMELQTAIDALVRFCQEHP